MRSNAVLSGLFYGVIFLSAFLLFWVQPLMGRFILPWFGGSPEVWTTCMLFFQLFLLGGYAYAHLLARGTLRVQTTAHTLFLAASVLMLRIVPSASLRPSAGDLPIVQILLICTICIGMPYFFLSATSPLIQKWYSLVYPAKSPYRLYAVSNAGSILALAAFPFCFEPFFTRQQLAFGWTAAFVVFVVLCGICAAAAFKTPALPAAQVKPIPQSKQNKIATGDRLLWLFLPACASVELLAVTNKITQDIAVIPFLWILPLALYLLSFIICFEHSRWYKPAVFVPMFILGIAGVIYARLVEGGMNITVIIGLYSFMLFACCMVCHGQLYLLRPASESLTAYYLMISAGGAAGGIFVGLIAPMIFNAYHELHLGLLVAVVAVLLSQKEASLPQRRRFFWVAAVSVVGMVGILFQGRLSLDNQIAIDNCRNFFGVLTVLEASPEDPQQHQLLLRHGTTFHGMQFQNSGKKSIPTTYYGTDSGIGIAIANCPKSAGRRLGIVGLGVGTIAAYAKADDQICFYEINPDVERLARKYFSYLADCPAAVKVALGDARLSLENQPPQQYDILVIDAFSSDAVPLHLLTREVFQTYMKHVAPDGILAVHISTNYLDLQSVVWKQAQHLGLDSVWIEGFVNEETGTLDSDWILLGRPGSWIQQPRIKQHQSTSYADLSKIDLWTDDHINLIQILRKLPER